MKRVTSETEITVEIGTDKNSLRMKDAVLEHMLRTLFFYMGQKVTVEAEYDLRHHLWEDMGITIGQEINSLYDRSRIQRYGTAFIPMDDALVMVSLDFSRCFVRYEPDCESSEEGFEPALFGEFLWGLARNAGMTIHVKKISGTNTHHIIEAGFKALGCAMKTALGHSGEIPSTKGVL